MPYISLVSRLPRLTAKGSLVFLLRFPGTGSKSTPSFRMSNQISLVTCNRVKNMESEENSYCALPRLSANIPQEVLTIASFFCQTRL